MELVAYAILIYETFNRPRFAQFIERLVFPWASHSLGPMQVQTDHRLTDLESVALGVNMLKEYFRQTNEELTGRRESRYMIIRQTLAKYNRDEDYIGEIIRVIRTLWAQVVPDFRNEFENMHSKPIV